MQSIFKNAMIYHLKAPKSIYANILLPASKSISNRVLILNALCRQPDSILNLAACDDTGAMIKALELRSNVMDIGAAGTAMRFLTAYLAITEGLWILTGTERMKNRPIRILVDALRFVGAEIEYMEKEGFPPLQIRGKTLRGGELYLDAGVSSQYISALLMIAPLMTDGLRLHLEGAVISRPYIELTRMLMHVFGVTVYEEGQTYTVTPQHYAPTTLFTVESDWSAASYWYAIMALSDDAQACITLKGLRADSMQGDVGIAGLFDRLGVKTTFTASGVTLTKKQKETGDDVFLFDFIDMPDMVQTLVTTCVMLDIPFIFKGVQSLKIKETDRLAALQTELAKLGFPIAVLNGDTLRWDGSRCAPLSEPVISTYNDHRMAMAFAPLALRLPEGIAIAEPDVVSKSYPTYWDDLKNVGFSID